MILTIIKTICSVLFPSNTIEGISVEPVGVAVDACIGIAAEGVGVWVCAIVSVNVRAVNRKWFGLVRQISCSVLWAKI